MPVRTAAARGARSTARARGPLGRDPGPGSPPVRRLGSRRRLRTGGRGCPGFPGQTGGAVDPARCQSVVSGSSFGRWPSEASAARTRSSGTSP
ncbi:hypothetical protein B7R87_12595 [Streptomyces tsukubensis]|nr:hypothetical protein B7R87_12595 [Streptomyces tsukubensis]